MALSRIWSAFIIIAIGLACVKGFVFPDKGNKNIFTNMVTGKSADTIKVKTLDSVQVNAAIVAAIAVKKIDTTNGLSTFRNGAGKYVTYKIQTADGVVETCKTAVNLCIGLIGMLALFMGFLAIAEKAGGINLLSRAIGPFFSKIFPDVPKGHPAVGHMMMNFSANLLGLDNAATPFGIKAMESLQTINPTKETASNAQIMFLCLHASGLTLIPVSIIAMRSAAKAGNPLDIFIPCMIATFVATIAAMLIISFKQKINVFQPVILMWVFGITAIILLLLIYLKSLDENGLQFFSGALSNGLILLIFIAIVLGGLYKKIDVFDSFIEGAKGGFETAVRIIPYLVGMLVAISLLRTSGTFDAIINTVKTIFAALGADTRFVDGLPTALVKPFSGGAARGMMVDTMKTYGADSFAGRLSCVLQGSSDTTFYVIAVYFGAIGVKNTRYAVGSMLLADLVGIITAIGLSYFFFG
jgi:spore maturation protein SpmA